MQRLRTLHLFAGAGGGLLADVLLGHQPVCAVEIDEYCQQVLSARQEDGCFPWFPIFEDVQAFDGRPWRGIVDIVAGGFPCQDISVAGNGAGLDGERSGMWHHMARIIGEVRPRYVLVENSPALTSRGLGRVLGDLAALGLDAQWGVLGASDVGAPHKRERIWIVANTRSSGRRGEPGGWEMEQPGRAEAICTGDVAYATCEQPHWSGPRAEQNWGTEFADDGCDVADADSLRELQPQRRECDQRRRPCNDCGATHLPDGDGDGVQGLEPEPQPGGHGRPAGLHGRARIFQPGPTDPADAPKSSVGRVADGVAHRSHRIKALGNGQVPRVAAAAWKLLTDT